MVDHDDPEGSFTDQENRYVVEDRAFFTKTTMVTPEELDSKTRLGEGVRVYVSPVALAWLAIPERRMLASRTEHRANLSGCLGNKSTAYGISNVLNSGILKI